MASRPKRRKASRATPTTRSPSIKSGTTPVTPPPVDKEIMLQSCMAQILPTIEDTFGQYMDNFHSQHSAIHHWHQQRINYPPLLLVKVGPRILPHVYPRSRYCWKNSFQPSFSFSFSGLTLGVDDKIKAKIRKSTLNFPSYSNRILPWNRINTNQLRKMGRYSLSSLRK